MTSWDTFFKDRITKLFSEKKRVIDIGGGLRISKKKGNRYDSSRLWAVPLAEKIEYKILDPVADYAPDIVGDIHALPFADSSEEAILCLSVLEHVENPWKAAEELYRVLKPGGYLFVHVPFLFYYHAERGYYKDYWRFTEDSVEILFKRFSIREFIPIRGAIGSWVHLSPLGRSKVISWFARKLDRGLGKHTSKQVSGYYIFLQK